LANTVHVGRRAGATLQHVDDKVVVQLADDDLIGSFGDCVGNIFGQRTAI